MNPNNPNKPSVFFVLGGPGAGKGTQCSKLIDEFHVIHLSAGELLREERSRKGSKNGELIEQIMLEGGIVPSEITVALLDQAMQERGLDKQYLIDGFPRNQENYNTWHTLMNNKVQFKRLLFFNCDESVLKDRIKLRALDSGRVDDNDETLMKRLTTYNQSTKPIIDYFDGLGLVVHINAQGSVEQVFEQIKCKLDGII